MEVIDRRAGGGEERSREKCDRVLALQRIRESARLAQDGEPVRRRDRERGVRNDVQRVRDAGDERPPIGERVIRLRLRDRRRNEKEEQQRRGGSDREPEKLRS